MEALIVAVAGLVVIVLLEAGYWIALCLMRWAPSLALGALTAWLAFRHGVESMEALALGAFATLLMRRFVGPRFVDHAE
ncbi:MAG: hypothetical protein DCF16_01725 [Alphaproteobacteria bacterium]|nr:MAG: hypothetical protein DCF16_01725 [Alphaproteobacteria bacterium]